MTIYRAYPLKPIVAKMISLTLANNMPQDTAGEVADVKEISVIFQCLFVNKPSPTTFVEHDIEHTSDAPIRSKHTVRLQDKKHPDF